MRPKPNIGVDGESQAHFPSRWINRAEAMRLVGRSDRTIYTWENSGLIVRRSRGGVPVYEAGQLLRARHESAERQKVTRFHLGHERTAGIGRPRHRARPQIAHMIAEGYANAEIWRECGCSETLVMTVRRELGAANA